MERTKKKIEPQLGHIKYFQVLMVGSHTVQLLIKLMLNWLILKQQQQQKI